ncbi:MAG: CDGSH iron-sulfur domain-containing protein [Clostridiales bacterium]|nr:CDGSH iron-sulfur domain-containing protein [Clostridiales bacterium]
MHSLNSEQKRLSVFLSAAEFFPGDKHRVQLFQIFNFAEFGLVHVAHSFTYPVINKFTIIAKACKAQAVADTVNIVYDKTDAQQVVLCRCGHSKRKPF